jgi:hypothetical protein
LEKYRIYKLKIGDTIDRVAYELGITNLELTGFHNVYCKNEDCIGFKFPAHLKELLVYPHIREFKKDKHPTVQFTSITTLEYKPNYKKRSYGVMYTVWSGEKINTIKFHVSVVCKEQTKEGFHFEIDRISKTFVNDLECNFIADELAEKVSKVIYPLTVLVSNEGKYIHVTNFEKIQKKWEINKENILDEYEGEWVEKYIALSEQTLQSQSVFSQSLAKDWFLSAYFVGIYANYCKLFTLENSVEFPLIPNVANVCYRVTQEIDPYLENNKFAHIELNGILNDPRAKADFENGSNFPDYALQDPNAPKTSGDFKAKYVINSKTNGIESVLLECSIELKVPQKVQVVISLLNS